MKPLILTLAISMISLGCSLYQSEGREFLEDKAFAFKNNQVASVGITAYLAPCMQTLLTDYSFFESPHWIETQIQEDSNYRIFKVPSHGIHSLVAVTQPKGQETLFACEWNFETENELWDSYNDVIRNSHKIIQTMTQ